MGLVGSPEMMALGLFEIRSSISVRTTESAALPVWITMSGLDFVPDLIDKVIIAQFQ